MEESLLPKGAKYFEGEAALMAQVESMWTIQLCKMFQFTSANASCCSFTVLHVYY